VAALSMSGSSFIVAVNALMLKGLRLPREDLEGPSKPGAPPAPGEPVAESA
jgi:Cu2+-exporting ATPase